MPEYLVLWRSTATITAGQWIGPNTDAQHVVADSPREAAEAFDAPYGEVLVLSPTDGAHFAIGRTLDEVVA